MAAEQQQPTIVGGAELCLRSFQECLQQSASIHPREVSLVEDQLARFSIWSASIGVFAPGRASMDHRLREAPDIQEVVRGLLDGLNDGIQNCSSVLKTIGDTQPKNTEGALLVADENLNRSLRAIANEISLLHRLSNTIRRASKESQNLKAAKAFRIKDDDGNDAEPLLEGVFANYILGRFPDISDTLRQRLASTMLLRRKRILYRRSRYGKTPIRPKKMVLQPIMKLPLIQQQTADGPEQPQLQDGHEVAAKSTQSIVQSMAVSATTLAADNFKRASTPSVVSQTKTVALGSHEDLIFPPAPTGRLKQKYRQLKKLREEEHKAYLKSIPGYFADYRKQSNPESFLKGLADFMQLRGMPVDMNPIVGDRKIALYTLYFTVSKFGGHKQVAARNGWPQVAHAMHFNLMQTQTAPQQLKTHYEHYLALFEERFRRKFSDAEAKLERTLEKDWNYCSQVIAEVTCRFCFYALPSLDVIDEKKWKAHVKNDLDAYICLFEECDKPEELYNHSDEWLKHMREHALRWRCNSKSHGGLVFDTQAKYLDHMRTKHGAFTEAQLRVLAERSAQIIGPLFESCPFCGTNEVKGRLEDHIVGHLRFLALKSFPPYQDEGSEDSRSEKGSLGTSEPRSRSTIKMDPERYMTPIFVDVGEQSRFEKSDSGNPNAADPYSAWGGFRGYISQYPDGLKETAELGPQIAEMESRGFERSQIDTAMRAANYDCERAMDYLLTPNSLPPPLEDAMSWPTPETALEEEKRKAQELENSEREEKDESASNKPRPKEKWVAVPFIPTVAFNTPIPPRSRRKSEGRARPGRTEGDSRLNHSEPSNTTGDKAQPNYTASGIPESLQEEARAAPPAAAPQGEGSSTPAAPVAAPLFPHLSADGASLGGPLRPRQRFPLPPIPDNNELQPRQWFEDPSTDFVEESLFDKTADADRRVFEWGFVPEAYESSSTLENDLIIQSILTYRSALSGAEFETIRKLQAERNADHAAKERPKLFDPPLPAVIIEEERRVLNSGGDNLDSHRLSPDVDMYSHDGETDVAIGTPSRGAGKNDEDFQGRTEGQGKELIKMTTPAFLDENYFRKLQSISDQVTTEHAFNSLSHDGRSINKEAFCPNYFKRWFVEERELGRGGKGVVLLVRHEIDDVSLGQFACKRIPIGDDVTWLEKVLIEVQLLQRLSHPNLVSYRHVWLEDVKLNRFGPSVPCAFILQQYCNSGDLLRYIIGPTTVRSSKEQLKEQMRRRSKGLPDIRTPRVARVLSFEEIYSFFKDITSGLAYLHSTHHVHRDLKPSNILLHRDGSEFHCLISDFGEVQPENALQISTGATGTISYCAPEVLKQDKSGRYENYTTKSDIFSLGMVLHLICFGRLPYKRANHSEDEEDIDLLRAEIIPWPGFQAEGGERRERPELPNQLYELLKRLLDIDPTNRPSAKEIRESLELEQSIR